MQLGIVVMWFYQYRYPHHKDKTISLTSCGYDRNLYSCMLVLLKLGPGFFRIVLQVREDLNDALLMFCQAYFFERLQECRSTYRPSYGGSLSDLLLKINQAKRDSLLVGSVPSTTSREVIISDTDTDPACQDYAVCPVNCLRTKGQFTYDITTDSKDFSDLNQYRVSSLELEVSKIWNTKIHQRDKGLLCLTSSRKHSLYGHRYQQWTEVKICGAIYLCSNQESQ